MDIFAAITNSCGMQDDREGEPEAPAEAPPEAAAGAGGEEEQAKMDVSPPHHPVQNWGDVFVHLAIITAGLFIALTLEGVVEWVHHRTLVSEARENIRLEIRHNLGVAKQDLAYLKANQARVEGNIRTLQRFHISRNFHGTLTNTMEFAPMDQSAWRTARDTGALGYMPYAEVRHYSGLYETIDLVNNRALGVMDTEFKAFAPAEMGYDLKDMPNEQLDAMLHGNADTKIGLTTLQQMVQQVDRQLSDADAGKWPD
ncbi:MAG TPA: hypothetical protein VGF77_17420 [Allosphingosinicella sp.]